MASGNKTRCIARVMTMKSPNEDRKRYFSKKELKKSVQNTPIKAGMCCYTYADDATRFKADRAERSFLAFYS
ncbi:hypothetical protein CIPAW_08G046100 [Carya illinoinensis]|uniref:Uncharacterized protein n=1 Tax=Carya illinoinensis TaxID=32201 RepID=A0A8T1PR34_CARIL|nr:hypothetical protein CIPAW_08G046100 [Carya illinoinensis]